MKALFPIIAITLALAGCDSTDSPAPAPTPTMTAADTPTSSPTPVAQTARQPLRAQSPQADDPDFEEPTTQSPNLADAAPSCWADYCPCDRTNPDFGGIDVTICRNLKMGIEVSDEQFSFGAQSRDARQQLREFDREHPDIR